MQALPSSSYRFDNFELDIARRRLLRDGHPVTLNPKAFDMLLVLVEHNGRLVSKENLFHLVWPDQIVEESNLTVNMSAIRRALGETASAPHYITTVSGRGYTFTAELRDDDDERDILIESQTLSRIVVEDEAYEEIDDLPPRSDKPRLALPGRTTARSWILLLGLIAVGLTAAMLYFAFRQQTELPFSKISTKRLTSTGRVTVATLSPDGKLFAYAQEESDGRSTLLLGHVDGSSRVELRPPQFVSYISMSFTPDGSRLYYGIMSDDPGSSGIYRLPAFGGAAEKIKDAFWSRIAFSPDGKQLAFVKNDNEAQTSSLRTADTSWQSEREITSRPNDLGFVASTVDWSPDGSSIVTSAVVDSTTLKQELFVTDVARGTTRQLTKSNWDGVRAVAWLNGGRGMIATAGINDVGWDTKLWHISESDGTARRLIGDLNAYGIIARLSADKRSLLTVQAEYYSNIWLGPSDDLGSAKEITHDMLGGLNGWLGVQWLPDGRLLYTSRKNWNESIWVMDADGANQRQVIPDGGRNYEVSASSDGRVIAFASDRGGTDEIWLANSDGTAMRQLTTGGSNLQPHIAPDGSWVIFQSTRNGVASLWRFPTSSDGVATQFTDLPSGWAGISPDGKQVAAQCNVDGKSKLCIFTDAGGEPVKTFDVPSRANFRLGAHWTPDGTAVTYRDWGYGIWRQDLAGGAPMRLKGLPQEKLYAYGWSSDGKQFAFARGMAIQDVVLITSEE